LDAVGTRLLFLGDLGFAMGFFQRRKLTQELIDQWNDRIEKSSPPTTVVQRREREDVQKQVKEYKVAYEHSEFDGADRYARALNTFFCAMFYSPIWPGAAFLGLIGLCMQYGIDKYMMLRWNKQPSRPLNQFGATRSLRILHYYLPIGFATSFFIFLLPSFADKKRAFYWFLYFLAPAGVLIVLPRSFLRTVLGFKMFVYAESEETLKRRKSAGENGGRMVDYYTAQHMWPKEMKYHMDQFLYKTLGPSKNPEILVPEESHVADVSDFSTTVGRVTTVGSVTSRVTSQGVAATETQGDMSGQATEDKRLAWRVAGGKAKNLARTTRMAQAGHAASLSDKLAHSASSIWQWERSTDKEEPEDSAGKWENYPREVQTMIENRYQSCLNRKGNPRLELTLENDHHHVTLDFNKMTQRGYGGKIRRLRRIESE